MRTEALGDRLGLRPSGTPLLVVAVATLFVSPIPPPVRPQRNSSRLFTVVASRKQQERPAGAGPATGARPLSGPEVRTWVAAAASLIWRSPKALRSVRIPWFLAGRSHAEPCHFHPWSWQVRWRCGAGAADAGLGGRRRRLLKSLAAQGTCGAPGVDAAVGTRRNAPSCTADQYRGPSAV